MPYSVIAFATLVVCVLPTRAYFRRRYGCSPPATVQYLVETVALSCLLLLLLRREGVPLNAVGLRLTTLSCFAFHAAIGIIAVVATDILAVLLRRFNPGIIRPVPAAHFDSIPRGKAVLAFIPVCIVGAFWEELCFRGVPLYQAPPSFLGTAVVCVVSSLIFGLQHLRGGLVSVIFSGYFGMIFCILYLVTRDLPSIMLAHAVGNLTVIFYFAPKSRNFGRPLPAFF
jgi:membrane protease YdiL (CAAX protease family)